MSGDRAGGRPSGGVRAGRNAGARMRGGAGASGRFRGPAPDGKRDHLDWLSLVELSGPFLSLPVLLQQWPNLDALDTEVRHRLRAAHADWISDTKANQDAWTDFVLRDLLEWHEELRTDPGELLGLRVSVPEHDAHVDASFALVDPGTPPLGEASAVAADIAADMTAVRLLGLVFPPDTSLTARVKGEEWAASPVDRMALLCRHHGVQLGLVTDGRWWALVRAPRGGATTYAVFDAITWPEVADRTVVRAFYSLLRRKRFFVVPQDEQLIALLDESALQGEDVTEQLGVQVRRAVELLVDAIGRAEKQLRAEQGRDLADAGVTAHEVYRGAVAVMMRIVFLLFAEDTRLLPSDNALYAESYSAARLCEQLEERVREASGLEEELEHSTSAWHRLLALFRAVHDGVDHPELAMHAYDGSLFDPDAFPWLEGRLPVHAEESGESGSAGGESSTYRGDGRDGGNAGNGRSSDSAAVAPLAIDNRTVYHMLLAVQYVVIGVGRAKERRRLTFRTLDVEQIGYVYEGLLSFEGFRAPDTVVGLIGKEGLEEEVELSELEELARPFLRAGGAAAATGAAAGVGIGAGTATGSGGSGTFDTMGFAAKLAEKYKDSSIGSKAALAKRLEPPSSEADRKTVVMRLHASTADAALTDRLLPFAGIIRDDLRGLPVVIKRGSLYVTESRLRKNTGTHYTPRNLAEKVVKGALEPLVYEPGPLQTTDRSAWVPKSAAEILALKVADIAMGSAAFLVAACRYLADRLVEAWAREAEAGSAATPDADVDVEAELHATKTSADLIKARRLVIEHCLYGVDINPMAVEMAKLSLWLVSMDPERPFTFLDDRLVTGDSLLGISRLEQLEFMSLDPKPSESHRHDETKGVRGLVNQLIIQRDYITRLEPLDDKRRVLDEVNKKAKTASLYADLVVGAALSSAGKGTKVRAAREQVAVQRLTGDVETARAIATDWLATDQPEGSFDREPVHWPLVFPEVFARGGFDAIIGNPPFLGGKKITGPMGTAYREYLVEVLGHGVKGNADLVAYFVLRAHELSRPTGQTGLIATNTLAQGDTREVGLDQIVASGAEIREAVKSEPWPSKSAVLQYCAVWTSRAPVADAAARILDGLSVKGITCSLDPGSRVIGQPHRLAENRDKAFIGSYVLGMGFTMRPEEAHHLIAQDPRNAEVLFPYLNGQDLNQTGAASRWVIDFHAWSEDRAKAYPDCYERVVKLVKPERAKTNQRDYKELWWRYARRGSARIAATAGLDRVIVITLVSKVVMPMMVTTGQVFSHMLGVFATDDTAMLALLSSAPHYWWAIGRASTMKGDLRYTPTDVFETFARPELTDELRSLGERLDTYRRTLMESRESGLTSTYNLVHDASCADLDIVTLRGIHCDIDYAVVRAYGWHDLADSGLDHAHHETRQGVRYTVGPAVRQEILDRLLELNHARFAAEHLAAGGKSTRTDPARATTSSPTSTTSTRGTTSESRTTTARNAIRAEPEDGTLF